MTPKEDLTSLVTQMITGLSTPLPPKEIGGGWDDETRLRWLPYYKELLQRIERGEYITPSQDFQVCRMLDMSGITSGELCELAAQISGALERAVGWNRHSTNEPRKLQWKNPGET